jgi:RNA 3'-terminal phosphate cyclase (ATP)
MTLGPEDLQTMIQIDGSQHSGSGTIVRHSVAYAALTGQAIHVVNARARRDKPGLRRQHIRVIQAIGDLVGGHAEGLVPGSREFVFRPGAMPSGTSFDWDIGSAGSTTMLALGILPVLAFAAKPMTILLRGGIFQDFAPSFYHLNSVIMPLLARMGFQVNIKMVRPGYVPKGEGVLELNVLPAARPLAGLILEEAGPVSRLWGIALASHLQARQVAERMVRSTESVLVPAGYRAEIEVINDMSAVQPGAALAVFADRAGDGSHRSSGSLIRLGADQAGARGRPAEAIGTTVARQLLEDLTHDATVDRWSADQIIPFAALAEGTSRVRIPGATDHVVTNAWLAETFLGAKISVRDHELVVSGTGYRPK